MVWPATLARKGWVEQFLLQYPEAIFLQSQTSCRQRAGIPARQGSQDQLHPETPLGTKARAKLLPLMPMAVEQWDLSEYDLIISSNHAVAKGIITGPYQLHISYVHTPIRYAWEFQYHTCERATWNVVLKSMFIRAMLHVHAFLGLCGCQSRRCFCR